MATNFKTPDYFTTKTLNILETSDRPLTAADLALMIGLSGSRETRRRKIREIVKNLRNEGLWIVATNPAGYWLTGDAEIWRDYQNDKQIDAKRILGETGRHKKMIADRTGQGFLFAPAVSVGIG